MLTSGHHFGVETGRWEDIPYDERMCTQCNNLDDDRHALFEYSRFMDRREKLATDLGLSEARDVFGIVAGLLRTSLETLFCEPILRCLLIL